MIETIMIYVSIFVFIFSVLSILRLGINFLTSVLSNPPKKLEVGQKDLIYYGIVISYIITFLIAVL